MHRSTRYGQPVAGLQLDVEERRPDFAPRHLTCGPSQQPIVADGRDVPHFPGHVDKSRAVCRKDEHVCCSSKLNVDVVLLVRMEFPLGQAQPQEAMRLLDYVLDTKHLCEVE